MAKEVKAKVLGGKSLDELEVKTVQEAFDKLGLTGNYTATVNGEPREMSHVLSDFNQVHFSAAVKGGK